MSREHRRVQLAPAYILHHQPYRDTSRILEAFTREQGRLTLFARGVRGPKARLAAVLQPFRPLLLSWSAYGEAAQLTGAECTPEPAPLPAQCLLPCFYLNELLMRLTARHDPHSALFDAYAAALDALKRGRALEPTLRIFEKRLLEAVGFGLDLATDADTGCGISAEAHYRFHPAQGLKRTAPGGRGVLAGRALVALANESLERPADLKDARALLAAAIAQCLEGRELATRTVARSMARRERPSSGAAPRERP